MKTFTNMARQGDVLFMRVDKLPSNALPVPAKEGLVIVAHSETGHHHVMDAERTTMYRLPDEIYDCFLVVGSTGDVLNHLRDFDTHEPISFEPGIYRARRQREHTPEGMRRVED